MWVDSRADGAEHGPDFVVIDHPDSFVGGGAPDGGIFRHTSAGRVAQLPVVIVVVSHDAKRLAAVTPCGIGLVNRHLCAIQHAIAEHLVGMIIERSEKSDANLVEVLRSGSGMSRAAPLYSTRSW